MQLQEQDEAAKDSRLQRIGNQTKGLVDDVKSWVELRMELTQIDVEDRVEQRVNEAMAGAAMAGLAAVTVLFFLVAAAVLLGDLLGHLAYGFLAVGGLLLIVTVVLHKMRPTMVRINRNRSRKA